MIRKIYLSATLLLSVGFTADAQIGTMKNIGQVAEWTQSIKSASLTSAKGDHSNTFLIPTPTGANLPMTINVRNNDNGAIMIAGDDQKGKFSLSVDASGKVSGFYHSVPERKAYTYNSNTAGNVFMTEVAIESLICMDFERMGEIPSDEAEISKRPARTSAIPKYSSKPGSQYVIYIDLDDESTNSK